jgi:hypothetical protein
MTLKHWDSQPSAPQDRRGGATIALEVDSMPIEEIKPSETTVRRFRRLLWTVAALAALSLAAGLVFRPALVGVSAITLAGASLMIIISGLGRTRAVVVEEALRTNMPVGDAARKTGTRTAIRITAALTLAAFATAAAMLDREMLAAGAAFTLAIFSVVGAPAWLAAVGETEDATRQALQSRRAEMRPGGRTERD